jgi:hypothetical protein
MEKIYEAEVISASVRDGGDDFHIECRFSNGEKFAAIIVDLSHPELASKICGFLNRKDNGNDNANLIADLKTVFADLRDDEFSLVPLLNRCISALEIS